MKINPPFAPFIASFRSTFLLGCSHDKSRKRAAFNSRVLLINEVALIFFEDCRMELKMEVLVEYCLVFTVMRILSALAAVTPKTNTDEAATSSCERIQIPECYGIGYDL